MSRRKLMCAKCTVIFTTHSSNRRVCYKCLPKAVAVKMKAIGEPTSPFGAVDQELVSYNNAKVTKDQFDRKVSLAKELVRNDIKIAKALKERKNEGIADIIHADPVDTSSTNNKKGKKDEKNPKK